MSQHPHQHLNQLIHRHLDGSLNLSEIEELNSLLKSDPAHADRFAEIAVLHHTLQSGFRSGALASKHTHATTSKPDRKPIHPSWAKPALPWLLATAAAIAAIITLRPHTPQPPHPLATVEKHNTGFAILTHTVAPTWSGNSPVKGDLLPQGLLQLTSGLAQIEFFSGVSLVVEGNAALEIISPHEMRLLRGKLRAHVPPPAIGFKIHTPQGTVLDLGTEFALDVSANNSELHVINGEVEWHEEAEEKTLLTQGQALHLSSEKNSPIPAQPSRFTSPTQLAQQITTQQNQRFATWKNHTHTLPSQNNILAHFPMAKLDPWNRQLPSQTTPGTIIGAKVVPGRWPQKQALDFSPNGSRVRLHIPGKHQALTYSTWAKIDSLDRQFNALFLTDNYGLGEPHWQLLADGRLFFSVGLGKDKHHHIFHSPIVWDHTKSEQWLHLATTYQVSTRTCTHYLNGHQISQQTAPPEKGVNSLTIGNAQLGNWGLPTREEPEFAVRNLNGRLDEFTLYNTALSQSQVQSLYQSGKP